MKSFNSIVKDISTLKIQGAVNIAKASLDAISLVQAKSHKTLLSSLNKSRRQLFNARPTEPALRNSINYILYGIDQTQDYLDLKELVEARVKLAKEHFKSTNLKIPRIGERKVQNSSVIFTHCHSSTVVDVLKYAKSKGKKFIVHNTETRPRYQGRKTATELAKHGIPVVHYVDSAARLALKKADLVLIGADAITSEGKVINKIGSEMIVEMANNYQIPIYICSDSWKFDPLSINGTEEPIEIRSSKEVWDKKPKGVKIMNYAFEKIDPDLITGIISELGVFKPEIFMQEVRLKYPWMFTSLF